MSGKSSGRAAVAYDRRAFLSGTAATVALGAVAVPGGSAAQTAAPAAGAIDVHHHFFTPRFVEEMRDRFMLEVRGMEDQTEAVRNWRISDSLEAMDQAGVATSMLSLNTPGPWRGDIEKTRALCRHCNDYAARAVHDHPGRFGHLASLPLPDVEGSLREIAYALDTLHADGFILHTNDEDKWLGHPDYWPVYEELDRRGATIHVHPQTPGCCQQVPIASPPALLEYPFDTARAISNWIFSGAAARFPGIKLIFSHGGGAVSMLLGRLDTVARVKPDLARFVPEGAHHEIRKFYYDTASIYFPTAFAAVREMVPRSQILFGSDVPFGKPETLLETLNRLVPDPGDQKAIRRDNALALFPRLQH